jgi:hypothetical protein
MLLRALTLCALQHGASGSAEPIPSLGRAARVGSRAQARDLTERSREEPDDATKL